MEIKKVSTDILIIGGGTAGCYGAITAAEQSNTKILVVEKANIKRSGCLAAGVNALNAYITEGRVPQDYVDYAKKDADGIVREDLLLSMAEGLNKVTQHLEKLGLVILKDESGKYVARGNRNIKINGENIKVLLAQAVESYKNITVMNHINITDFLITGKRDEKTSSHLTKIPQRVTGAIGFDVNQNTVYVISAKAVLCATGGAAGLYRPNNPGFSKHKMWYSPFNTGAGYAMGILAGAEMTTFEMRFIALRCKDTIAPTGTIAQGVGAKQVNARGDIYENKYGITTAERVYGTVKENADGNGPCYLHTEGILEEQNQELLKAYLNMAPSQTLKWIESGKKPSEQDVEIEGTEPYIVGGHTASGYWIDVDRRTTLAGLYAAGDVAGGCPQKYVTGALVEGEIAAYTILKDIEQLEKVVPDSTQVDKKIEEYEKYLKKHSSFYTTAQLEEAMQKVMDQYAGGIGTNYQYNEKQLGLAEEKIERLKELSTYLFAADMDELMRIYELKERLVVCGVLIAHLKARKETRWHSFGENTDYPEKNKEWMKYVNSVYENGKSKIILRDLVTI